MGLLILCVILLLILVSYGEVLAGWASAATDLLSRLRGKIMTWLFPPPPDPLAPADPNAPPPAPSNLLAKALGGALALLLVIFVLVEGRYRLLQRFTLDKKVCPRCGGEIVRMHRTGTERLISELLLSGAYHYKCKECGWNGLRRRRYHGEHATD
jgi:predicted RNA-binding Zn-ribbon protein involved in translation (DUF1610 family)